MMEQLSKSRFRILRIILLGVLLSGSIFAQPNRPGDHPPMLPDSTRIVQMTADLAESLDLSAEQYETISELYFAHFAEAKEKMQEQKTSREKHRKAMDTLRRKFENDVKSVLTDEQIPAYEQFIKQHRPDQGKRRPRQR